MLPLLHFAAVLVAVAAHVPVLESTSSIPSSGPHIAELNVLLPPRTTNPVEYRLQGSGGCFSWSWDHHDVLSVQPEYNDSRRCSTSARLISIAPYSGRKETAVYATDIQSGTVIRCEVFIEKISRIRIFHHSVKLDLHGLATLRVHAFDEEENIFTSLVGLRFLWQFMPKPADVNHLDHHLVHVPLKDTPLSDCGGFCGDLNTQIKLEESGVGSDLYVVKGTEIGHEIVSVHLLEQELEHLADEIVLTVVEAISLDPPSPVFVLVGAFVQYSLRVIHQNTPQAIILPSAYHQWSVSNSTVAQVDSMMGIAHALKLGVTDIIVKDIRLDGHLQFSSMHVVLPSELQLYIVPLTPSYDVVEGSKPTTSRGIWYITSGQDYAIYMKVFSHGPDAQEIYISEKDDVKLQFNDSARWSVFLLPADISMKHGWRVSRLIKATSPGLGSVAASLTSHYGVNEKMETLKVLQQILVCNQVKISMSEKNGHYQTIRLPWAQGISQEIELTATGGCAKTSKDYIWFSSDVATVSVSGTGLVKAHRPGRAIIKVATIFDSMNYDEIVVEVSIPSSMVMLQTFPVEAVVGTYLQAAVTLKTSHGDPFCRCDSFGSFIRWQVLVGSDYFKIMSRKEEELEFRMSSEVLEYNPHYGSPCGWVNLYASHPGRAMLQATLSKDLQSSDHSLDGPIHLKTSLHIAAYLPLVVRQAGNGNLFGGYWVDLSRSETEFQGASSDDLDELLLVPATGVDILLLGGPEHWDQEVEFIETVEVFSEDHQPLKDGVDAIVVKQSFHSGQLYRISCPILGFFKLAFSRGNLVGDGHPVPAIADVELSLICAFPSSITVIANEPANRLDLILSASQADRGQGRIRTSAVTVANGCTIRVAAVSIHSSGRAFANSSSLSLAWELSGCEKLAYWKPDDRLESSESSWERLLVLQNATGLCIVRATVIGFSAHLPDTEDTYLPLENSDDVLTDAVRLQLVSSLRVIPEYILLFFNPDAKANISVTGGTCYLDAAVNDTQVVEVIQLPSITRCAHLMLGVKGVGISLVTVHDLGLSPPSVASAMVRVADVDWIKIKSEEAIKLMEGCSITIDILAGNYDGGTFDSSQYAYITTHVHLDNDVLELVDKDGLSRISGREINSPEFTIRGAHLGITTLYVSVRQRSGHEILSEFIEVEVYALPRIHPDYVFLAPGASYVLVIKGGPQIGVVFEYSSVDDLTASVQNTSGRVSAISVGNTTIHATFYGHTGTVICQANGRVEVGIPSSMTLNLQSEQLGVGREMPIFPWFPEGNLFSFYGLCNNYQWSIEDEQVLTFQKAKSQFHYGSHELASAGKMENDLGFADSVDLGFINVVYGRSAGRTMVAVSFSCDFISSGLVSHSVFYNASASLLVIASPPLALGAPITWVLPPFYTSSEVLPASSESGEWDSRGRKRSIIYSLLKPCHGKSDFLHQDAIAIDEGRIKTKESNNIACILAKDRLTGNIEVASCVRVAEVAQVRASTKEFSCRVADIAVGSKLELFINYRDALGNPFYEAHGVVSLEVETNYPDVLSIQTEHNTTDFRNRKIYLQAMRHGRALVRISISKSPTKADYILISVGAHLQPQNPILNIQQYLNFSVIGEGTTTLPSGRWASSNESVIFINELSGEAHAVGEGVAQVLFEGSNLKLQTTVNVRKAGLILVEAPAETLTNVPFRAKGFNFLVQFRDSYEHFGATVNDSGILYDCKVDPAFIGYAKPWRDLDAGYSYCLFFPHSPEYFVLLVPKLKAMRSSGSDSLVYISIIASLREAPQVMGSAHALFIGGFSVLEMGKVNLTPNCNRSIITIVGNTDVEVHWKARDRMLVSLLRRDDSGMGGRAEYEVQILPGKQFTDKIIFVLPATGQTAEIDVSYANGQSATSSWTSGVVLVAVLVCAVVLVVTVLFFIRLLDRPERPIQSGSTVPAPAITLTPNRSPSNTEFSPRTPQPYVDYVKRTIDETPYYRRGRRSFDPQRTY